MISKLDKRRKQIFAILSKVPISSTQQLANLTKVSNETMRKDLDALSDEGLIVKVHGGVALATGNNVEIPFDLRASKNVVQKKAIAHRAVSLIQPNDTILLESCTTNLELARELVKQPELLETLIVVTNSFSIVSIFDGGRKCRSMFFLGGWIHTSQYSASGQITAETLKAFHLSKAFLSGAALSNQFILSGYYQNDVDFQKNAISAADEIILMIDSSKFGQNAVFSVSPLSAFDYVITDKDLSPEESAQIENEKTRYLFAPVQKNP